MKSFKVVDFAVAIRVKRTQEGQSIREAADKIGVDYSVVNRAENMKVPTVTHFHAICDWLGRKHTDFLVDKPI